MSEKIRRPYHEMMPIAEKVKALLAPDCERIEIAGSLRRKKDFIGDIEIVCIPKPFDVGLFASGIAKTVDQWQKVKGEVTGKYTQRILPEGVVLDLFMVNPESWGLQLAIRTGSADFSHKVLACGWVKAGYKCEDGLLRRFGGIVQVREERDLFNLIGLEWVDPMDRSL